MTNAGSDVFLNLNSKLEAEVVVGDRTDGSAILVTGFSGPLTLMQIFCWFPSQNTTRSHVHLFC
mgnify:CR=1 FL=1